MLCCNPWWTNNFKHRKNRRKYCLFRKGEYSFVPLPFDIFSSYPNKFHSDHFLIDDSLQLVKIVKCRTDNNRRHKIIEDIFYVTGEEQHLRYERIGGALSSILDRRPFDAQTPLIEIEYPASSADSGPFVRSTAPITWRKMIPQISFHVSAWIWRTYCAINPTFQTRIPNVGLVIVADNRFTVVCLVVGKNNVSLMMLLLQERWNMMTIFLYSFQMLSTILLIVVWLLCYPFENVCI